MGELILKRASASRPSGEWNKDDFDALADGAVVGRIFRANASPVIQVAKATYLSVSGLNVIAPHHGVSYRETNTLLVACASKLTDITCREPMRIRRSPLVSGGSNLA